MGSRAHDRRWWSPASAATSGARSPSCCTRTERIIGIDRRPFPGSAEGRRAVPARPAQEEGRGRLPHARREGGHPHGDHARPADERGGAPLVQRGGHHARARVVREVRGEEGGRALQRQRLRPEPGQLELPHRGRAADGGLAASRACATSSRSTCSRTASSGGTRTSRRSSCGRCTSSGPPSRTRRPTTCGCGTRGCWRASTRWCSSSTWRTRRARWSRRCGPGSKGVYNVVGPGEVPLSAVLPRAGAHADPGAAPARAAAARDAVPLPARELPAAGAGPHPVPLHGGREPVDGGRGLGAGALDEGHDSIGGRGAGGGVKG